MTRVANDNALNSVQCLTQCHLKNKFKKKITNREPIETIDSVAVSDKYTPSLLATFWAIVANITHGIDSIRPSLSCVDWQPSTDIQPIVP